MLSLTYLEKTTKTDISLFNVKNVVFIYKKIPVVWLLVDGSNFLSKEFEKKPSKVCLRFLLLGVSNVS